MAKLGDNNSRARGLSRVIGWPDGPPSQVRDLTAQCVVLAAENMVLSHNNMVVLIITLVLVGYSMNILCGGNFCWNTNDNDIKQRRFWGCDDVRTFYCKCNFLMNPNVSLWVGWLVCLPICLSDGQNLLNDREDTLPCSYPSTCFFIGDMSILCCWDRLF